ncbi:hypothetical protein [Ketogulonicigenium vulgare]|uniref:hypothetical protein n=1 Tax=Ketogulonicigenium vulgare TaxID=92945 RepID=UPI002359E38A|nr:hypothetical protein [Ketogulonicigenium vulgare]
MRMPLAVWRLYRQALPQRALHRPRLQPGPIRSIRLHADPSGNYQIRWSSPARRVIELEVNCMTPGAWLGLHLPFRVSLFRPKAGLSFAMRAAAIPPLPVYAVLRVPQDGARFRDIPFDRPALVLPQTGYHFGACSDPLPLSRWREFILFLPPAQDFCLTLHDLQLGHLPGRQ